MSSVAYHPTDHQIYPKRYFDASPTWFAWNKLTAGDVYGLRDERGFEGQNVYFYLNHPIQFISLTGLIVQVELAGGSGSSKYCLVSIDDGSGDIINVRITRRIHTKNDEAVYPSNTLVDNLDVDVGFGIPGLSVDKSVVLLGTPVRVRGSITTFRDIRQLELKRIKVLQSTNEEARSWMETARWKNDVLSIPWSLTQTDRDRIDGELQAQDERDVERRRKKKEWHARQTEKREKADRKSEAKREVLDAYYNKGALVGSEQIKAPWESA